MWVILRKGCYNMIQKSFQNANPSLYIVATPIGNLSEMTPRAIEILNDVDIIACEDTRTSSVLLHYFNIKKKCISYHNFNEKESANGIVKLLKEGKNIALISDAGYPLLCDPGVELTKRVIEEGYNVIPISGSNAFLNALVSSGMSVHPFFFFGFLNSNQSQRLKQLKDHSIYSCTLVYYESPHRITKTLKDMYDVLGNRKICIAREITKKHEEFIRITLEEALEIQSLKGELVLIVEGKEEEEIHQDIYLNELELLIKNGEKKSSAIKIVAKKYNISKNDLYELIHK